MPWWNRQVFAFDGRTKRKIFRKKEKETIKEDSASHYQERFRAMKDSLVSPRERFFKSFINITDGLKFLVDLRGDLLRLARNMEKFDWRDIDQDIISLLDMWFLEGFLHLSEIGLNTP
ncbi:MAG: hypothetical protein A2157_18495 [Deltaproteobacteria bacterium RBG_16_47_11]|nr:MAG: hypothetical protein A2157_18495 [Deltaproteobacteria bacterium RBG_16_47_11]